MTRAAENVLWARFTTQPNFVKRPHRTGRQQTGVRYEREVHELFLARFPEYIPSPWIVFHNGERLRWCQPDGLFVDFQHGRVTAVEIKYQHTVDAWFQLWHLYEPVLRKLFRPTLWSISCLTVVKWFDPLVAFPGKVVLLDSPISRISENTTGVHILNPHRSKYAQRDEGAQVRSTSETLEEFGQSVCGLPG